MKHFIKELIFFAVMATVPYVLFLTYVTTADNLAAHKNADAEVSRKLDEINALVSKMRVDQILSQSKRSASVKRGAHTLTHLHPTKSSGSPFYRIGDWSEYFQLLNQGGAPITNELLEEWSKAKVEISPDTTRQSLHVHADGTVWYDSHQASGLPLLK